MNVRHQTIGNTARRQAAPALICVRHLTGLALDLDSNLGLGLLLPQPSAAR